MMPINSFDGHHSISFFERFALRASIHTYAPKIHLPGYIYIQDPSTQRTRTQDWRTVSLLSASLASMFHSRELSGERSSDRHHADTKLFCHSPIVQHKGA